MAGGYGQSTMTAEEAKNAFQDAADGKTAKAPDMMEDWKTLKTWKGHHNRSKFTHEVIFVKRYRTSRGAQTICTSLPAQPTQLSAFGT